MLDRRSLAPAALAAASLHLVACLDANELDAPRYGTDISVEFVDLGIPYDPRQPTPSADADSGDDDAGGGGDGEPGVDAPADDVPPVSECDDARPCASPFVCTDGVCAPECELPDDCGAAFVCIDFECVEIECETRDDCDPLAEECAGGLCVDNPCALQVFTFDPGATTYTSVLVSGAFNAWAESERDGAFALQFDATRRTWWGKFEVENGAWEYKLLLDGTTWIADPANPDSVSDGFGGQNSVLTVDCSGGGTAGACGDLEAFDWRDTVMYFVMTDRFYDGDGRAVPVAGATDGPASGASGQYEGGDLDGVAQKMDYLTALGVTALWLSAPYDNRDTAGAAIDPRADTNLYSGYHGYWPSPANVDYSDPDAPSPTPAVESRIGTAADLRRVVSTAHAAASANGHGVKVLFDYVMNHVDLDSGLYRANPGWFARRDGQFALCGPDNLWDDPFWGTRCAFTDYLPPFDFDNDDARRWSIDDALWWAREYGIDGYRLDAIKHVPVEWLTDLRSRLNEAFTDSEGERFYLVGETFAYDDRDLIKRYVDPDTMLDGQFDFPLKARLCEALFTPGGSLSDFASWIAGNDSFYGPGSLMTTWIGNHDIPRAIHFASRQIGSCREGSSVGNGWTSASFPQPTDAAPYERLGLAFAVMMTNPGIPLIYYGDEIGLAGGGDPDNRRMMEWDDARLVAGQRALRESVATLARVRAENPVLARGRRVTRSATRDIWVYSMVGCGDGSPDVTVAINRGDAATNVDVPPGDYIDLVSDTAVGGGPVSVSARGYRLLRRAID